MLHAMGVFVFMRRGSLALLLCLLPLVVAAQGLPRARNPEEVGLSSERLKRLTETFQTEITKGTMPGAVLLVARRGKVAYYEAMGARDPQTSDAMRTDAIFRLASMTKPFVSVAAMMLVEEGRLTLTDPVSRYLPEFKGAQVGGNARMRAASRCWCWSPPNAKQPYRICCVTRRD